MQRDTKYLLGAAGVVGLIAWDHKRRQKVTPALGMYGAYGASAAAAAKATKSVISKTGLGPCTYPMISRNRTVRGMRFFTPAEAKRKSAARRFRKLKKEYRSLYDVYDQKADAVIDAVDTNRADADKMVKALKTGKGGGSNMEMAHYLIYDLGDGKDDGILLNNLGKFITPRLRAQVKSAVNQYYATTSALDNVLVPIKTGLAKIAGVVTCAGDSADKLIWASTRPIELLWGYCTEAEGAHQGWIRDRRQFFRESEYAAGTTYGPDDSSTERRRKWNKVCDQWRQDDPSHGVTKYEWPRWNDPNHESMTGVPRPRVYSTVSNRLNRRGCLVGESCGVNPDAWEVRECIRAAESAGTYVSQLVADDNAYVNTLLAEADRLMAQLRVVAATVREILWDILTIVRSAAFKAALVTARAVLAASGIALAFTGPLGGAAGIGLLAAALVGGEKINTVLDRMEAGFKDTRRELRRMRADISGARTQLSEARTEWNKTPWRRRARQYIASGQTIAAKLHRPWEWAQAEGLCSTVFPRISDDCMSDAIRATGEQTECPAVTGSFKPTERLPPGVLDWKGPGGRALSDSGLRTFETEGERGDREDSDGGLSFSGYGELTARSGNGGGIKLMSPLGLALLGGTIWLLSRETWSKA